MPWLKVSFSFYWCGRAKTEGIGTAHLLLLLEEGLQDGQDVGGGLARPGAGLCNQVMAIEGQRDGLLLDEGGSLEALARQ